MFPGFRSAEHAEKVRSQRIDYWYYCNYYFCAQSRQWHPWERSLDQTNRLANEIRNLQVTIRYCVTAGSATSRWKTLRAELGEALGRLILAWETRSWLAMMTSFCSSSQAAICPRGQTAISTIYDVPRCRHSAIMIALWWLSEMMAFGNEACQPTCCWRGNQINIESSSNSKWNSNNNNP